MSSGRIWMIVSAGCLGAIVLTAAAVGGFAYLLFGSVRRSGAYQDALRELRAHPSARQLLGEPIEPGWFTSGNINVTPASGQANLAIPVSGPKGRGTLYVEAVKRAGEWKMNLLQLAPPNGGRIDLLGFAGWSDIALRQACDQSNGGACNTLALRLSGKTGGGNEVAAAALFRRACEAGHAPGCSNLGARLDNGVGVARDAAGAVSLFQRACDGGAALGCVNLGHMLDEGRGVAADPVRAAAVYQKGCDGDAAYCAFAGAMHELGRGVRPDLVQAAQLYRKACDAGDGRGCSHLGVLYHRGTGVAKDDARSVELFRLACDRGFALGCYNLGIAHTEGAGTAAVDPGRATSLFEQACVGGIEEACRLAATGGMPASRASTGK